MAAATIATEVGGSTASLAGREVVEGTLCVGAWVDTLQVAVENVLEVVEVVSLTASALVVGICFGHTRGPSIVATESCGNIASAVTKNGIEILASDINVGLGIVAGVVGVAVWALVWGDLHQSDFAVWSSCTGIAGRFLQGDRSEEDGWNASLTCYSIEVVEVALARSKDAVGLTEGIFERNVDHVAQVDGGRNPSTASDTAIEPIFRTVWTATRGWAGRSIWITASKV